MIETDGINLILFNIFKTGIGFDARQILNLTPFNNESAAVVPIQKFLALTEQQPDFSNPRLMTVRSHPDFKILIEEPYDLIHVNRSAISPLPEIMKTKAAGRGLWGLFFTHGFLYSLYDTRLLIS